MKIRQTEQQSRFHQCRLDLRLPMLLCRRRRALLTIFHRCAGERRSKSRRCSAVPPPLRAAQRDNATAPRLGVHHATMETETELPCGGEMLSKHGGLSANVSVKRGGDELRPMGKKTHCRYILKLFIPVLSVELKCRIKPKTNTTWLQYLHTISLTTVNKAPLMCKHQKTIISRLIQLSWPPPKQWHTFELVWTAVESRPPLHCLTKATVT